MERNERYKLVSRFLDLFNNKNNFVVKIDHNVLFELVTANNAQKEEIFVHLIKEMPFFSNHQIKCNTCSG